MKLIQSGTISLSYDLMVETTVYIPMTFNRHQMSGTMKLDLVNKLFVQTMCTNIRKDTTDLVNHMEFNPHKENDL